MVVWWRDEDGRPLTQPVYTLPTGWAQFNWATADRDGDVLRVSVVPLEEIGGAGLWADSGGGGKKEQQDERTRGREDERTRPCLVARAAIKRMVMVL